MPAARPVPAATLAVSEPEDPAEQEAEQVAEHVMGMLASGTPNPGPPITLAARRPMAQRALDDQATVQPQDGAGSFLVDDEAAIALPGQMHKTEFLQTLRPAVCAAADRELARAGRNTAGCPYLDRWFDYYQGRDAGQVERSLRKYAPETAAARSARDYIAPISARVAQGVHRWVDTGEVPALPDGMSPDMLAGGGVLGALASVGSAIASGLSAVGSFFGKLFFKARDGGAREGVDGAALHARLGSGQPLASAARSRMAAAFGHDFGHVRVHADPAAAQAATALNAHAFTIGHHIAFAPDKYRPGTLAGDALLAHELAHVMQQREHTVAERPVLAGGAGHDDMEHEADRAAVDAVSSLWEPSSGRKRLRRARSSLRSGLRLQRCAQTALSSVTPEQTPQDVDTIIQSNKFLQPYIDEKVKHGIRATGHLHIEDDDQFKNDYVAYAQKTINPSTHKGYTREEAEAEEPRIGGYREGTETYMRKWRGRLGYAVHESIHTYSSPAFLSFASQPGNEGVTEYFTNLVLEDHGLGKDASEYTEHQLPPVEKLVQVLGPSGKTVLAGAYFNGKLQALREAVDKARGQGTWNKWVAAMRAMDYSDASDALD
jgi:hypothetical protein